MSEAEPPDDHGDPDAHAPSPHPDTVQGPPVSGDDFLSPAPDGTATGLIVETSEGGQELSSRSATDAGELRREVGAVLRLPEGVAIDPSDIDVERTATTPERFLHAVTAVSPFPVSDSSQTIIDCLMNAARAAGVMKYSI